MITIRHETPFDAAQREALLDAAFGNFRFTKTAERLREGRRPAEGLSFVACAGDRLIGTVRLWNIAAGRGRPALLLGPLAVESDFRQCGIGGDLVRHALAQAQRHRHRAVLLVGDAPYYGRFGFAAEKTGALSLPGPYRATGCWPASSCRARSKVLVGSCEQPAGPSRTPLPRRLLPVGPAVVRR